ncbi:MAG: UDP-N-acetylmuramate dehydrogenase [Candidatus Eisenbacteria bacterium]
MLSVPIEIRSDEPLSAHTFWKLGGPARHFAEPNTEEELLYCLRRAEAEGWRVLALGGGSNLLIADSGFDGLAIAYRGASESAVEKGERARVRLGAGALLAPAARRWARQGWAGLEWAEGIPGTIGGAVAGNAGAYGGDVAGALRSVEVLSDATRVESWTVEDCGFAYRRSHLRELGPGRAFVVAATFLFRRSEPTRLVERMSAIGAERKAKTPAGLSCGSVWKNPPGDHAGRLIESAGLKGLREGAAEISTVHANYIVNRGGALASDVLRLIERVEAAIEDRFGVRLEREVQLIGYPESDR